ncbi:MAG: peptide-methionine (R)-S-oxide reductase MsrB [Candidatus Gracilibacteria bacterium]|nr:peptide-methionine (R)-S-oxide reductase MsrB [bacterium]MDZ4217278.1 peptide-methionine (R)-S-oxide reductase MsrB [Candidatus Gracilibacteria bacterium]
MPTPSPDDLRSRLTPEQYQITQKKGTERPFTGEYWDTFKDGMYHCVVCGAPLFQSETKYDAGCGWPSFYQAAEEGSIAEHEDITHGMSRTEVVCSACGAHLGHVFPDGPPDKTGLRYCINSASLKLKSIGSEESK